MISKHKRTVKIIALAIVAALVAPVAGAQGDGAAEGEMAATEGQTTNLTIYGHDDGSEYWFTVGEEEGERNPPISLRPGAQVTVHFIVPETATVAHNVHFGGPIDEATEIIQPGEERWLNFTVPADASGEYEYWCDPHRALGMVGPLIISEEEAAAPGDNVTEQPPAEQPPAEEPAAEEPPAQEVGAEEETPGFTGALALAAVGAALLAFRRRRG